MIIPKEAIKMGINQTAKDPGRYAIQSMAIEDKNGQHRAIGTDGKSVSVLTWGKGKIESHDIDGMDVSRKISKTVLIDKETMSNISKIIPKMADTFSIDDTQDDNVKVGLNLTFGNSVIINMRKDESCFPNIDDILSDVKAPKASVKVDIKLLERILKTTRDCGFDSVSIDLSGSDDMVVISGAHKGTKDNGLGLKLKSLLCTIVSS